jgi:hypothetical protein
VVRLLGATVVALLLWAVLVAGAAASEQWCEDDPVVVIVTPRGTLVPLYLTNAALGIEHLPALQAAKVTYTASPAGAATVVRMGVTVPPDKFDERFPTRTTASTGPLRTGMILADAQGFSGQTMLMQFTLDVP